MELNLKIKTEQKTKDNSKISFLFKVFFMITIVVFIIAILVIGKYSFYINVSNEKEKIEVNAIYSNQITK